MFGKKLETGMWGQREQQQIKKKNLKKKRCFGKVSQMVTKPNKDGVEKMIIQTGASFSDQVGCILRTENVPGSRKEGIEIRTSRENRVNFKM